MLGKNQRNGFEKWQNDEFSKEPSSKGTTNRFVEENNFFFLLLKHSIFIAYCGLYTNKFSNDLLL